MTDFTSPGRSDAVLVAVGTNVLQYGLVAHGFEVSHQVAQSQHGTVAPVVVGPFGC